MGTTTSLMLFINVHAALKHLEKGSCIKHMFKPFNDLLVPIEKSSHTM